MLPIILCIDQQHPTLQPGQLLGSFFGSFQAFSQGELRARCYLRTLLPQLKHSNFPDSEVVSATNLPISLQSDYILVQHSRVSKPWINASLKSPIHTLQPLAASVRQLTTHFTLIPSALHCSIHASEFHLSYPTLPPWLFPECCSQPFLNPQLFELMAFLPWMRRNLVRLPTSLVLPILQFPSPIPLMPHFLSVIAAPFWATLQAAFRPLRTSCLALFSSINQSLPQPAALCSLELRREREKKKTEPPNLTVSWIWKVRA